MKSAAQKSYEKVQKSLLMAPGMIEESERRLLFKAAFNCRLPVVKFGAFFGASTLALAKEQSARETKSYPLTCIDAFEVRTDHSLIKMSSAMPSVAKQINCFRQIKRKLTG